MILNNIFNDITKNLQNLSKEIENRDKDFNVKKTNIQNKNIIYQSNVFETRQKAVQKAMPLNEEILNTLSQEKRNLEYGRIQTNNQENELVSNYLKKINNIFNI